MKCKTFVPLTPKSAVLLTFSGSYNPAVGALFTDVRILAINMYCDDFLWQATCYKGSKNC